MKTRNGRSGMALLGVILAIGIVALSCYVLLRFMVPEHRGRSASPVSAPPPGVVTVPTFPSLSPQPPRSFPRFRHSAPRAVHPDVTKSLDETVKGLPWGHTAFNHPKTMELGQTIQVQLLVSRTKSIEELKSEVVAAGAKEGSKVRVSDRMQAELTGSGFQIKPDKPVLQGVSSEKTAEWEWDVKGIEPGLQVLRLTLSAILEVDGHETPFAVETFRKDLEVRVTVAHQVTSFVGNNWQWLFGTILIPLAGAIWAWWRHRRKSKEESSSIDRSAQEGDRDNEKN